MVCNSSQKRPNTKHDDWHPAETVSEDDEEHSLGQTGLPPCVGWLVFNSHSAYEYDEVGNCDEYEEEEIDANKYRNRVLPAFRFVTREL